MCRFMLSAMFLLQRLMWYDCVENTSVYENGAVHVLLVTDAGYEIYFHCLM